jgi:hypothetical protein
MDVIPMCSIFQELQIVHDTGYFSALPSLEEYWQQVFIFVNSPIFLYRNSKMNETCFPHRSKLVRNCRLLSVERQAVRNMQNNTKLYYLDL